MAFSVSALETGVNLFSEIRKKIREHEKDLANMLQRLDESNTQYFKDHEKVMGELSTFSKTYDQFKHDFFGFIEKLI